MYAMVGDGATVCNFRGLLLSCLIFGNIACVGSGFSLLGVMPCLVVVIPQAFGSVGGSEEWRSVRYPPTVGKVVDFALLVSAR